MINDIKHGRLKARDVPHDVPLDMQMHMRPGIWNNYGDRGKFDEASRNFRKFVIPCFSLAIIPRLCLAAAREDSRTVAVDASPLRTFDAHTRPIIESQVSSRRDKWCIGRPIRFHQISAYG